MRRSYGIVAAVGLGLGVALLQTSCFFTVDLDDCSWNPSPHCFDGGSGADGGDGGPPPDCSGDPTMDPGIVTDTCGVFVSANAAPGGDGTQATPFQTFAEAAAVNPARVFACAGSYTETVQVSFSGGVAVYGGFTGCTGTSWAWSATMQAEIATVAGVPGVVLDGGANKLENVSVTAPNVPTTMLGGSSIAVLVNGGSLDMTNGALTAGDAQDGAAGTTVADDPTLDGAMGASGLGTCDTGATSPGAPGAMNTCTTGGSSTAGNGGDGGDSTGDPAGSGTNGSPADASQPMDGVGGIGEGQMDASMMPATQCAGGIGGANGSTGGSGGGATGIGALTKAGYQGGAGTAGTNGKPGQGGGGGGGAQGAMSVTCNSMTIARFGASGGAGGTGGCGGNAGGGGQPGGSSIALLVLDADVTLATLTLTAGKGGNGGNGGNGQSGGNLGSGGMPGSGVGSSPPPSCAGGSGGAGGNGGPGGGGQGGHSLGIAFQGTTAPTGGSFVISMTNNGTGGPGGQNNTAAGMGQGVPGIAENCWDFGTKMNCGT
jgi:hypothetical protein